MKEFIDKTSEQDGTPINRDSLMAIQGFDAGEIVFNDDGSITKTNANNEKLTMFPVNEKGICKTTISGQKTITKKTTFTPNLMLEELQ